MAKLLTIVSLSWLSLLGVAGVIGCECLPARAQQFSADLVRKVPRGEAAAFAGKLRVLNDKVRIETPEFPDGYFLTDSAGRAAYFARPGERVFMEARQSSRLTPLLVPVNVSDPCPQWRDMARLAGAADDGDSWRCERVGEELVNGRSLIIFRALSSAGNGFTGLIDPSLKFPLQIRLNDGTSITVANLHEEPQTASLFEIPGGFRKFDPEDLIRRIKQSDVWVEQPSP
jgi:hypothetical protein